jgi:hypothetical protein
VVIEPAPAIKGNAIGNMEVPCESLLKLNNSIPSIISIAIKKMINEPAMANDETSMPKMLKRGLPIIRNESKITKEAIVTFIGLIMPDLDLMSIIIGIAPGMSIIAKSTMNAASISMKLIFMIKIFDKDKTNLF